VYGYVDKTQDSAPRSTTLTAADPDRPNTTYSAPVGSVDLAVENEDGSPYEIWPCHDCYPWHAEVVRDSADIAIREWHAVDCPQFQRLIDDGEPDGTTPTPS
jgi:hypothetical protein